MFDDVEGIEGRPGGRSAVLRLVHYARSWVSSPVFFEIVGEISNVQTIAAGRKIRQLGRLKKLYGSGRWAR